MVAGELQVYFGRVFFRARPTVLCECWSMNKNYLFFIKSYKVAVAKSILYVSQRQKEVEKHFTAPHCIKKFRVVSGLYAVETLAYYLIVNVLKRKTNAVFTLSRFAVRAFSMSCTTTMPHELSNCLYSQLLHAKLV